MEAARLSTTPGHMFAYVLAVAAVAVPLGERSYRVEVGRGVRRHGVGDLHHRLDEFGLRPLGFGLDLEWLQVFPGNRADAGFLLLLRAQPRADLRKRQVRLRGEPVRITALVDLTLAISTINSWNRLAVSFRQSPGG